MKRLAFLLRWLADRLDKQVNEKTCAALYLVDFENGQISKIQRCGDAADSLTVEVNP